MTKDDILSQLTEIFHDIFDDDTIVLTRETTSEDIRDWDSANHINIIVATEMRFKIKFLVTELEGLKDIGTLVDLIAAKTGG